MTDTPKRAPYYNVGMSEADMTELIWLIDDEPVDENVLKGIRSALVNKRKMLRKRVREGVYT